MKLFISILLVVTGVSQCMVISNTNHAMNFTRGGGKNPNLPERIVADPGFRRFSIDMISDLLLITQTAITCNPMNGILGPAMATAQAISCSFNGMSVFSNLACKILEGWDMLDESNGFKKYVESHLQDWERNHMFEDIYKKKMNGTRIGKTEYSKPGLKPWDVQFDMYVKGKKEAEPLERQTCVLLTFGSKSIFVHDNFEQEICLTRYGLQYMNERQRRYNAANVSVRTAKSVYRMLVENGIMNSILEPPKFVLQILGRFRDYSEEFVSKLENVVETINRETWDGHEVGFKIAHEGKTVYTLSCKKTPPRGKD